MVVNESSQEVEIHASPGHSTFILAVIGKADGLKKSTGDRYQK
jgi:hypothetical protein